MIDPQIIRTQIQMGQAPNAWQIIPRHHQVRLMKIIGPIIFGLSFNFFYLVIGSLILSIASNQHLGKIGRASCWETM